MLNAVRDALAIGLTLTAEALDTAAGWLSPTVVGDRGQRVDFERALRLVHSADTTPVAAHPARFNQDGTVHYGTTTSQLLADPPPQDGDLLVGPAGTLVWHNGAWVGEPDA
jgi:hypothetical protein